MVAQTLSANQASSAGSWRASGSLRVFHLSKTPSASGGACDYDSLAAKHTKQEIQSKALEAVVQFV